MKMFFERFFGPKIKTSSRWVTSPMGNVEPKYIKSKYSLTSVKCRERDRESLFLILINEPPKKGGPTKPEKILHVF